MPKVRKLSREEVQQLAAAAQDEQAAEETPGSAPQDGQTLDHVYPHVADWVDGGGWIELGQNEYSRSFVR